MDGYIHLIGTRLNPVSLILGSQCICIDQGYRQIFKYICLDRIINIYHNQPQNNCGYHRDNFKRQIIQQLCLHVGHVLSTV